MIQGLNIACVVLAFAGLFCGMCSGWGMCEARQSESQNTRDAALLFALASVVLVTGALVGVARQ